MSRAGRVALEFTIVILFTSSPIPTLAMLTLSPTAPKVMLEESGVDPARVVVVVVVFLDGSSFGGEGGFLAASILSMAA